MNAQDRARIRAAVDQARRAKIAAEKKRNRCGPRLPGFEPTSHGSAGYAQGCRCKGCTLGHSSAQRASRARRKAARA